VDTNMLLQRPTKNWATFNGDYTGQRFSPLKQINTTNVGSLTLAWSFQTHQAAMKATPLVVGASRIFRCRTTCGRRTRERAGRSGTSREHHPAITSPAAAWPCSRIEFISGRLTRT